VSGIHLLSFFTGGGFFDLGFEQAGFKVCFTNELDERTSKLYSSGMTSWRLSLDKNATSVQISSNKSIEDLSVKEILDCAFPDEQPALFGVIGGPPCTDFSIGGVQAGHDGKAGRLTSVYVSKLRKLKPSFFVLENVPHLSTNEKHSTKLETLLKSIENAGYVYVKTILNALDYGVPQDRQRLFVVGFRRELLRAWMPKTKNLKAALQKTFSWPKATYPNAKLSYSWPGSTAFRGSPSKPADIPEDLCSLHAFDQGNDPELVANGKDCFKPYSKKFQVIKEGDVSKKSFKRLHRFRYSPTAWYGNNEVHLHPWKPRRISVREALRLQSVPDSYIMPAEVPLSTKFKTICNGVPCLLAKHLAEAINKYIQDGQNGLLKGSQTAAKHG